MVSPHMEDIFKSFILFIATKGLIHSIRKSLFTHTLYLCFSLRHDIFEWESTLNTEIQSLANELNIHCMC